MILIIYFQRRNIEDLGTPYSRRIPGLYISHFRSLSKYDKLQIVTASSDSDNFSEETIPKCSDISLNFLCTYDVTFASIASQWFKYFVTEALRNFENCVSSGKDWLYHDAKGVLYNNKIA